MIDLLRGNRRDRAVTKQVPHAGRDSRARRRFSECPAEIYDFTRTPDDLELHDRSEHGDS
jgi:hypothetical protein